MIHAGSGSGCDYDPATIPAPSADGPGPVWELATMFPEQGSWTEEEYLQLTDWSNRLVEYTKGRLEFLSMPTRRHQQVLMWLLLRLNAFVEAKQLGMVLPAGMRVYFAPDEFRMPDIVYLSAANESRWGGERYWQGIDLAVEIVSPDRRSDERDYATKTADYAAGGVPEYWVVDPQQSKVTVYTLPEGAKAYALHGEFTPGQQATSKLLEGFEVDVAALFESAKE
ncbi:MAG: Uma2 family endonuclease [Lacipirellulaceae bacterium]